MEQLKKYFETTPKEILNKESEKLEYLNEIGPDVLEYVKVVKDYINQEYNMIATKEEYVKKELDKLNLKPSKREIIIKRIEYELPITELEEIISGYRDSYNNIEIVPEFDDDIESPIISIRVIVNETEEEFNARLKSTISNIENDYDRLIKLLQL